PVPACAGAARGPSAQARDDAGLGELADRGPNLRQLVLELRQLRVVRALELPSQVTLAQAKQQLLRRLLVDAIALGDRVQLREDGDELVFGRLLVDEHVSYLSVLLRVEVLGAELREHAQERPMRAHSGERVALELCH